MWVPSQNGLFFDCPQRHRIHVYAGYSVPLRHSTGVPSASTIMVWCEMGTPFGMKYGPFLVTLILGGFCSFSMVELAPCLIIVVWVDVYSVACL